MAEKIRIKCSIKPHGIEFETIEQQKQLDIGGLYRIPVGIETELDVACVVEKITVKDNQEVVEKVGDIKYKFKVDDNTGYLEYIFDKNVLQAFLPKIPLLGIFK